MPAVMSSEAEFAALAMDRETLQHLVLKRCVRAAYARREREGVCAVPPKCSLEHGVQS